MEHEARMRSEKVGYSRHCILLKVGMEGARTGLVHHIYGWYVCGVWLNILLSRVCYSEP